MFPSRASWFKHELQTHRLEWVCTFGDCGSRSFETAASFQSHLEFRHSTLFTAAQIPAAISQCQEPVGKIPLNACPLCQVCDCDKLEIKKQDSLCGKCNNVWEASLRKTQRVQAMADPSILEKPLYGTPKDFRRHLARHMEQLALFALPKHLSSGDSDGDVGSNNAAADLEQDSLSLEEVLAYSRGSSVKGESLMPTNKASETRNDTVREGPAKGKQPNSPSMLSLDILQQNCARANELYNTIYNSYHCQCTFPHEVNIRLRLDSLELCDASETFELIFPIRDMSEPDIESPTSPSNILITTTKDSNMRYSILPTPKRTIVTA